MMKSLQIGRGLAALGVAAFHLAIPVNVAGSNGAYVFQPYTDRGNLGVDFFFVLSGFIMAFAHRNDIGMPTALKRYASKRFLRIYPLYWLFTAIVLVGALLFAGQNRPPDSFGEWLTTISLIRFQDYPTPLSVAWTLFHEILFYAMFAVLIVNKRLGIVAMAIWIVAISSAFHYVQHGSFSFVDAFLAANNLSFFCGMAAYYVIKHLTVRAAVWLLLIGWVLFLIVFYAEHTSGWNPYFQLTYSIAFGAIIAAATALERAGFVMELPIFTLIGNASYTLYLSHENVESTMLKAITKLGILHSLDLRLWYVVILVTTILFAIGFYWLIERPMLSFAQQLLRRERRGLLQDA